MNFEAPLPEALPTEIWATWFPLYRSSGPQFKLHTRRSFALSSIRSADSTRYCYTHRCREITRTWYDTGHRLYVLCPGQHWKDVSDQYLDRGIPVACSED